MDWPAFASDAELGYDSARTVFEAGTGLRLDASYRLCHLPLVAPLHPDVIARQDGRDYVLGRHGEVASLVIPVDADALDDSPHFRLLQAELADSPLSGKLAWDLLPKRRARLHATVCPALTQTGTGWLSEGQRERITALAPFAVEVRGLFSGTINLGRLYLRLYPETVAGHNAIHLVQRAMGRPEGTLHLAGLHNLVDHLSITETAALDALISRWWNRPLARLVIDHLAVMTSRDDLVLDAEIVDQPPLTGGHGSCKSPRRDVTPTKAGPATT
jgi:hypothetical protein